MMKYLAPSLVALSLALSGCQGGAKQTGVDVAQDVAVGVQRNLSTAEIADLKTVCTSAAPAVIAAVGPTAPKTVQDVAVYPYAFCTQLLSGSLTNPADHTSMQWLPAVLEDVALAAKAASFVLPLLL